MPQNSEELATVYKKVIEPKFKDWVIFEHGTCVIIYKSQGNLKKEAIETLKKYGVVTPGASSADFTVIKVDQGWVVAGDQPGILNYVSEEQGNGKEDYEIGLIGRNKKELDSKEMRIIYININEHMLYNPLTPQEEDIIESKGTESPFSGEYDDFYEDGVFVCKRCNAPLFSSGSKFDAGCGWPAFDDEYPDALLRIPDPDGERTEIECANCQAHLGHEFRDEHLTEKDTRHCVNSLSIRFMPKDKELPKIIHEN